jgi:high affinity Mn2+ porin
MYQLHNHTLTALALATLCAAAPARAADVEDEAYNAHYQATYIWQKKPGFSAPYSGPNSLRPAPESSYSFSATAALGWRAWRGGELYFDPELVQGVPLSGLTGLGGMTNGEQQKTGGPNPTLYRARLFLRQTWGLGGERVAVESDANQLAGTLDKRRLVLSVGNLALVDLFDNNAFAHDARTQFLNWTLLAHGAYDFAADARGYTSGAAVEYFYDDWALRAGRFMQPAESNGLPLDSRIMRHYGDQIELEHAHAIGGQPGKLRLLAYRNKARMGGFRDALADAPNNGGVPDVARVRGERVKTGFGLNAEQNLGEALGLFARASRQDGQTETYSFTEIERSLSAGALVKGTNWGRADDAAAVALARNGLSRAHRDYLAAGGHGAFIGDGKLSYRPEAIVEAYYSVNLAPGAWATLDYQRIANPAYNRDRGPVNVASVRLHAQY